MALKSFGRQTLNDNWYEDRAPPLRNGVLADDGQVELISTQRATHRNPNKNVGGRAQSRCEKQRKLALEKGGLAITMVQPHSIAECVRERPLMGPNEGSWAVVPKAQGFLIAFLAAFDAGDSVALCSAGYPCYRNILNALGCEVTTVPINAESKVTQKELKEVVDAGKKPRGLILSSPSNPTGAMLSPEELRGLCEYCEQEGILFISDEIYHGISFGKEEETALKFSDKCMVINSFSKYYSMTGWRLGWMVMPPGLVDAGNRLAQNLYINAPTLSQLAAVEAFDCEAELEAHVARYAENRRVVLAALDDMGVTSRAPSDGAFYVYADVGRFTRDAEGLCRRALEEAGVAFTPGTDFEDPTGPVGGSRVRFSFCGSTRDVREGMEALTQWWLKEFEEVLSTVQKELS